MVTIGELGWKVIGVTVGRAELGWEVVGEVLRLMEGQEFVDQVVGLSLSYSCSHLNVCITLNQ